jgi:glycosyltransferase involved in cell wall biosynthesis
MLLRRWDSPQLALAAVMPNWLERHLVHRSRRAFPASRDHRCGKELKRLYVDVSVVSVNDAGTGIQRVVRGVSTHLPQLAEGRWDVVFVSATRRQPYRMIDVTSGQPNGGPITAQPGDVFIGLDYALDAIPPNLEQLAQFRRSGGELWFFVHDLLPLQRPDWFSTQTSRRYVRWLRVLASVADGFFCNSSQTESELQQVLDSRFGVTKGYRTCVLPMGANLVPARQPRSTDRNVDLLPQLRGRPFVLMVGTLEPRKGHDEVLSAFEDLWEREEAVLVIVGRPGWKVQALQKRIRSHPLLGERLFWLDNADDAALEQLYEACEGVVVAALAEGFGLPLVEALGYRKPVLARDLPIFRQHHPRGVRFFPANATSAELADCLSAWLGEIRRGAIQITPEKCSWEQTTQALLAALKSEDTRATEAYRRYRS